MRVPAAQMLMLFSKNIDSNCNFSRVVFDSWIELRFPDEEAAGNLLFKAARLRRQWQRLLSLRLANTLDTIDDPVASNEEQDELERSLSVGLIDFMHSELLYSNRRLLPGDLKVKNLRFYLQLESITIRYLFKDFVCWTRTRSLRLFRRS